LSITATNRLNYGAASAVSWHVWITDSHGDNFNRDEQKLISTKKKMCSQKSKENA
jgi:hypothetical protein